jgi:hypothetical protein
MKCEYNLHSTYKERRITINITKVEYTKGQGGDPEQIGILAATATDDEFGSPVDLDAALANCPEIVFETLHRLVRRDAL